MSDFFGYISIDDVDDPLSFARYCQQRLGIPYPTGSRMVALRKNLKEFFANNPRATYGTLARTVEFCQNRNKRYATCVGVISAVGWALKAGYLPELKQESAETDTVLEDAIVSALAVEPDQAWRERLIASRGVDARREVYSQWQMQRSFLSRV